MKSLTKYCLSRIFFCPHFSPPLFHSSTLQTLSPEQQSAFISLLLAANIVTRTTVSPGDRPRLGTFSVTRLLFGLYWSSLDKQARHDFQLIINIFPHWVKITKQTLHTCVTFVCSLVEFLHIVWSSPLCDLFVRCSWYFVVNGCPT